MQVRNDAKVAAEFMPITIEVVIERRVDLIALEALLNENVEGSREVEAAASGMHFICYRLWELVNKLKESKS